MRRRSATATGKVLIMCGRFTQNYTWEQVHAFLSVFGPPRNLQPHYNIAPTDTVDALGMPRGKARGRALGASARSRADASPPMRVTIPRALFPRCRSRRLGATSPQRAASAFHP